MIKSSVQYIAYIAIFIIQAIIKGLTVGLNNYYNNLHNIHSRSLIITMEYSNPQVNFLCQGIKCQAKVKQMYVIIAKERTKNFCKTLRAHNTQNNDKGVKINPFTTNYYAVTQTDHLIGQAM